MHETLLSLKDYFLQFVRLNAWFQSETEKGEHQLRFNDATEENQAIN